MGTFRNRAIVLLAACGLTMAATSCKTDEAARYYGEIRYPPRSPDEVQVFTGKPDREFSVIADIQAYNVSPAHMIRRAAEIGGDGVIIVRGGGKADSDQVWASEDRYSNTYNRLIATVIKFK